MANVGYATLQVVPSMKGVSAAIAGEMAGAQGVARAAGASAGGAFGGDFKRLVANQLSGIPVIGTTLGNNLGATLTGAFGVAAVIGIGAGLVSLGASFDSAYDKIRVSTGETGKSFRGLQDDFRAVFAEVPNSMGEVATAIGDIHARTGQTGEGLQQLAIQMLDLSRLTGTDLKTNIVDITRLFGDWGIAAKDQSGTMDRLFATSQVTGVGINDLAQQVVFFGSPLRQLGFSLDESLALLGKWGREGVNVETVLGGMRQSLGRLNEATPQMVEQLQKVPGLFEAFQAAPDPAARFKLVKDAVLDLFQKGDPASKFQAATLAMTVFGKRAGADIVAAFSEGRFQIDETLGEIGKKTPDAIEHARSRTDDWGESWERVKHKLQLALEPLASRAFEGFSSVIEGMEGPLGSVTDYLKENKWAGTALAAVVGGILVVALLAATVALFSFAAGALAAAAIPLLIILGIGLLIAAVVFLYSKWDEVWSAIADNPYIAAIIFIIGTILTAGLLPLIVAVVAIAVYWQEIWAVIYGVVSTAADIVMAVVDALVSFVTAIWDAWGDDIMEVVSAAWNYVWAVISGVIAIISGIISFFAALFTGNWTALWNAVKQIASAVWGILLAGWQLFLSLLQLVLEVAWAAIQALWEAGWALFLAIVSAVWGFIVGLVQAAIGFVWEVITTGVGLIIGFWQAAWDLVLSLLSSAWAAIQGAVSAGIAAVVGFLSGLPGQALGVLEALVGLLLSLGERAMTAMRDGLSSAFGAVTGFLSGVAGSAAGAVGDLGGTLVNAGKALMEGLLSGIKAAFEKVKDFVSDIGSKIADLKGPLEYDRKLLVPQGAAIMGGLDKGLRAGWARIAPKLQGWSAELSAIGSDGASLSPHALASSQLRAGRLPDLEPVAMTVYDISTGEVYDGERFEERVSNVGRRLASDRDQALVESVRRKRKKVG